jgi:hypothetical protein
MKLGAEAELQRTNDTAMIFFSSRLKAKLRKHCLKNLAYQDSGENIE